jgi:hypothetical protein
MGRPRIAGAQLPEGVHVVRKPNGKSYYYFSPGRGTARATKPIALPGDTADPEFWRALGKARGAAIGAGTWRRLINEYRASPEWAALRPASQRDYSMYLDRLEAGAAEQLVADMTKADVYKLRDGMSKTPVAANHMLSVLRTVIEWGIPRGFRTDNPVVGIKRLRGDEQGGATPWPDEGYRFVLRHAPPDLYRMAFLGRATGQRAGDLVRMKPVHMESDGINLKIGKRREKPHFVPLTAAEVAEINSWGVDPQDLFIKSTVNRPYSADHLGSRWQRWRDSDETGPIRDLQMTIHGLRATKVQDLHATGRTPLQISDEIGMSVAMVSRYLRFSNKAGLARASRDERERKVAEFVNPKGNL